MAPVNTSFATATEILAFPYDFTQTDINDAGVNYTVYYKFTTPVGAQVMGAWGFSGNIGTGYRPGIAPYLGPAGAPTQVLGIASINTPIQFPVEESTEYFLAFVKNIDDAGPNECRVRVEVAPNDTPLNGDIVVNDDATGFPAVVLSPTTNYQIRRFYKNVAASDEGNILYPSDEIMFTAFGDVTDRYRIYDYDFQEVSTYPPIGDGSEFVSANQSSNKWYIGSSGAGGGSTKARYSTITGGVLGPVVDLSPTDPGMTCLAANNDDTILYWAGSLGSMGTPVKQWDIVNAVALADFAAGIASYLNEDIIVLEDDTILISYSKQSVVRDLFVRRYNAAGTILNTYSFGSDFVGGITPKITRALDSPDSFWIWIQHVVGTDPVGTFSNVRISDGAILSSVDHTTYTVGAYDGDDTATPLARFGHSSSCTFFILEVETPPVEPTETRVTQVATEVMTILSDLGGIYHLPPGKTHDSYYTDIEVKIPNPTIKTALIGE